MEETQLAAFEGDFSLLKEKMRLFVGGSPSSEEKLLVVGDSMSVVFDCTLGGAGMLYNGV